MKKKCVIYFVLVVLSLKCIPTAAIFLIIPEDVPSAFAAIYGFAPRLLIGRDHRVGFGFRFGNHADVQVMYELGPQLLTRPLQTIQTRSARQRQRIVRRPFIELLFRAGLIKDITTTYNTEDYDDEPR